uniref:Uncharacterized protein n=1 Tax=Pararge aegeria TaxID=116150 RepID=S4NS02_9NEOP
MKLKQKNVSFMVWDINQITLYPPVARFKQQFMSYDVKAYISMVCFKLIQCAKAVFRPAKFLVTEFCVLILFVSISDIVKT